MRQFRALTFGLLTLSACGSTSGGSVNGSVAGYSLHVVETVFLTLPESEENPAFTLIAFADRHGLCTGIQTGAWGKNTTSLWIDLEPSPPSPGTYSVAVGLPADQPRHAMAGFVKQDDRCNLAPGLSNSVPGTSGSVTLDSIQLSGRAKGTFDMNMSGDQLTGTFDAAYCEYPSSPRMTTCR